MYIDGNGAGGVAPLTYSEQTSHSVSAFDIVNFAKQIECVYSNHFTILLLLWWCAVAAGKPNE